MFRLPHPRCVRVASNRAVWKPSALRPTRRPRSLPLLSTSSAASWPRPSNARLAQLSEARNLITSALAVKDEALAASRDAFAQADAAVARAERAEAEAASTRGRLDQVREERESAREEALVLTGRLATVTSERDNAAAEVARERSYAEQRVTNVKDSLEQQLT